VLSVRTSRALRLTVLSVLIVVCAYFAWIRRFKIEALIWHWRNGYSTRLGEYEIPVPAEWLVERYDEAGFVELINTRPDRKAGALAHVSGVTVIVLPWPIGDLDKWQVHKREDLEQEGLTDIEEKMLQFDGDRFACSGGYELRHITGIPSVGAVSMECVSSGRLKLMFLGPASGLDDFYTIAGNIRKRIPG
jgi:hypothetical protein